jgi:hypothetical protein
MSSQDRGARWHLVLLAAARLAALYAIAVALLVLPLFLWQRRSLHHVHHLLGYALPSAFVFGVAFVLLAVARRAGFVALWVVLAGLWILILHGVVAAYPSDIISAFVGWSALAIPLAVLGGLGVPPTLRIQIGRWGGSAVSVAAVLWAALLTPALMVFVSPALPLHPLHYAALDRQVGEVAWFVWAPGALLISMLCLAHVWVGTAQSRVPAPAA